MTSDRRQRTASFAGLFGLLALALSLMAPAAAEAKYASLVMEAESGRVLHESNADTLSYPASLTKMMTLMLVFDALETGKLSLGSPLAVSARAAGQPPSKLGLRDGETISVRDAILALVTKSANDVAVVVAEGLGGTEARFAQMMTAKARAIGMSNTTFRNASGLPNDGQKSTARDMARLARTLLTDYQRYYGYFSTESFSYRGAVHTNHNRLLGSYQGTDGIKTGYIRASGFNLVASVQRNGTRLVGVVFGGRTGRSRDQHMESLFDQGFAKMSRMVLATVTPPSPEHRLPGAPAPVAAAVVASKARAAVTPPAAAKAIVAQADAMIEEGSSTPAAPSPGGDWGIQVGAYSTPDPAERIAQQAARTARDLLSGDGVVAVVPLVKKNGRQLYRARIHGMSEEKARQACTYLERKNISCMPLRMTEQQRLASRAG